MIIEVIGLPGSGKTTANKILERSLLNTDIIFYKSGDKKNIKCYFLAVFFCLKSIYLTYKISTYKFF